METCKLATAEACKLAEVCKLDLLATAEERKLALDAAHRAVQRTDARAMPQSSASFAFVASVAAFVSVAFAASISSFPPRV